jgi:hypothetical protein
VHRGNPWVGEHEGKGPEAVFFGVLRVGRTKILYFSDKNA